MASLMALEQEDRQRIQEAYRVMAMDEYGEDEIAPEGDVIMTWNGAFVPCRDGKYVLVAAVPADRRA